VKPGFSDKTELIFKGYGHQAEGCKTSNLVVTFEQESHCVFKRSGDNLVMKYKVSLTQAIKGMPIYVKTLDGRNITLMVDELISPKTCKEVEGEGMPNNQGCKGNLYIKFDIEFPVQFSTEARASIVNALKAN
jgi:DnaJ-class molecular chaperone